MNCRRGQSPSAMYSPVLRHQRVAIDVSMAFSRLNLSSWHGISWD